MTLRKLAPFFLSFCLVFGGRTIAAQAKKLGVLYQSPELINGVVTNGDTLYVVYPRIEGGPGIRLGRIRPGLITGTETSLLYL